MYGNMEIYEGDFKEGVGLRTER
jgi:radial spoke head protein 1